MNNEYQSFHVKVKSQGYSSCCESCCSHRSLKLEAFNRSVRTKWLFGLFYCFIHLSASPALLLRWLRDNYRDLRCLKKLEDLAQVWCLKVPHYTVQHSATEFYRVSRQLAPCLPEQKNHLTRSEQITEIWNTAFVGVIVVLAVLFVHHSVFNSILYFCICPVVARNNKSHFFSQSLRITKGAACTQAV